MLFLGLSVLPAVLVVAYFAGFALSPRWFHALAQGEAGVVELGTIVLFATAAWRALCLARRTEMTRGLRVLLGVYAAIACWVALEEASYGQQFLHWRSPTFFREHNRQGETNLHNLLDSKPSKRLHLTAEVGSTLLFVVLPLLAAASGGSVHSSPSRRTHARRWLKLIPGFELMPLVAIAWLITSLKGVAGLAPDLNELRELLWGWMALGYIEVLHRQDLGAIGL